jgi:hypothetical protein
MLESLVGIQFRRLVAGQRAFTILFEQLVQPGLLFVGQTEGKHTLGIGAFSQQIE